MRSSPAPKPLWPWPIIGLLIGVGCGSAWRAGGDKPAFDAAAEHKAMQRAAAVAAAKASKEKAEARAKTEAASPEANEAKLLQALAADDLAAARAGMIALAKLNGLRAVEIILATKSKLRDLLLADALYHGAVHDPKRVLALLRRNDELRKEPRYVSRVFEGMSKHHLQEALAAYRNPDDHWGLPALRGIGLAWAQQDWLNGMNYADALTDKAEREQLTKSILAIKMDVGFSDVAAWLQTLPKEKITALNIDWSKANPKTLADYLAITTLASARDFTPQRYDSSRLPERMANLIEATPQTKAWIDALPPGAARDLALETYATRLAAAHPEQLPQLLRETKDTSTRTRVSSTIAGIMAHENIERALHFAASLPDAHPQQTARLTALGVLGQQAPQRGLAMILAAEGELSASDIRVLAVIYGFTDPVSTITTAMRMKNLANAQTLIGQSLGRWIEQDSLAASAWATQLPPGSIRDTAAGALASSVGYSQPEVAANWIMSIGSEELRYAALRGLAWRWRTRSPEGFAAWLSSSGLTPATQQELSTIGGPQANPRWHLEHTVNGISVFRPH